MKDIVYAWVGSPPHEPWYWRNRATSWFLRRVLRRKSPMARLFDGLGWNVSW